MARNNRATSSGNASLPRLPSAGRSLAPVAATFGPSSVTGPNRSAVDADSRRDASAASGPLGNDRQPGVPLVRELDHPDRVTVRTHHVGDPPRVG